MAIKIRPTKLSDYEGIFSLLKKNKMIGSYFTKDLFKDLLAYNKGLYFIAEDNKKIIGSIFASQDGGYHGYMYKLAVDSKYRRRGIATKLLKIAINKLRDRLKVDWLFAHIKKKNLSSLRLFKSLGFKIRHTHYLVDNR